MPADGPMKFLFSSPRGTIDRQKIVISKLVKSTIKELELELGYS